jgi:hypothetical protein
MQPESTEIPTQYSNTPPQEQPATTFQYGFQSLDSQPHGSLPKQQRGSTASSSSPSARHASIDRDGATQEPLPGLNIDVAREVHAKPTAHRIFEYENALPSLPQKKRAEGPHFKVVKSGNTPNGPRIENFPNGTSVPDIYQT